MKADFGQSLFRNACSWIDKHTKSLFISQFVFPLIATIPVAILIPIVKTNAEIQQSSYLWQWIKSFAQTLADNTILVIFIIYLFGVLGRFLIALIRAYAKAEYSLDREDYIAFEETLSLVIDSKKRRFEDKVKQVKKSETVDAGEVFLEITKPLDQIRLLAVAIHTYLSYLDKKYKKGDADYRVGLMKVQNKYPIEWIEFKGGSGSPSLSPEELCSKNSTLMASIHKRRPVFIHDIEKELKKSQNERRHTELAHGLDSRGSLVCYPVKYSYNSDDIPYVITVKTDLRNHFKPEGLYVWAIERFVNRMTLEHSLLILREKSR